MSRGVEGARVQTRQSGSAWPARVRSVPTNPKGTTMSKNTAAETATTTALRLLPETTPEYVSVYGAAKAVNPILRGFGVNQKDLPAQQFYNYTTARIRGGHNPAMETVQMEDGSYRITRQGLDTWLVGYITRKGFSVDALVAPVAPAFALADEACMESTEA